jgi:hypothetical protein
MESIGLGTREPGLNAMITRLKRYASAAQSGLDITPHPETHG